MFKSFKLNTQLNISFYSLLFLLSVVALVASLGLKQSQGNFVEYRGLARETNLAGRLQANMLMTRLNVLKYINSDSPDILTEYQERVEKMDNFLSKAKEEIRSPKRASNVSESVVLIDEYKSGFNGIVELIAKRHKLVKQHLDPSGLNMRKKMTEILEYTHKTNNVESMYRAAKAQEALLLGRLYVVKFLVTNTDEDYQRAKLELETNISDDLKGLQSSLKSDDSQKLMDEFLLFYNRYLVALGEVYSVITERNDIIDNTLNRIGPIVADKIEQVKLSVKSEQDDLGPEAQRDAEASVIIVDVIALFSIVMGIIAAYILPKIIREPIGGEPLEIASITETISKGDLSHQFNEQSKTTGIYRSVINMSTSLSELIKCIVDTGRSIMESASNSAETAKATSESVFEQKQRISQVATSVNEMAYSIKEMVNISTQSAQSAKEAQMQAAKGKTIVEATVKSINSLASRVENSVGMIKTLEQNSQEIGSVVEVIQNISEQTNLLALNAAIEAARAGEQGRGFAVVADEVRTLAQRTQESTSEIQNTINALQVGTQNAVKSMEESGKEALDTVEQSSATGEALDSVLETINIITDMNAQVAIAVEEQSTVVADISANVSAISESSEAAAGAAETAAKSADWMSKLANDLQHSVQGFKVA